jgi:hypothetical protein
VVGRPLAVARFSATLLQAAARGAEVDDATFARSRSPTRSARPLRPAALDQLKRTEPGRSELVFDKPVAAAGHQSESSTQCHKIGEHLPPALA